MSCHCPNCKRVLYNRRLAHCGFCGAKLPEELRFTAEEVAALDQEHSKFEERRKQRQRAADIAEEEKELKRRENEIKAVLKGGF